MAWDWDRRGSRSGGTDGDDGGIEVPDPLGRGHRVQAEVKLQWLVLDPMGRGHGGVGGCGRGDQRGWTHAVEARGISGGESTPVERDHVGIRGVPEVLDPL